MSNSIVFSLSEQAMYSEVTTRVARKASEIDKKQLEISFVDCAICTRYKVIKINMNLKHLMT